MNENNNEALKIFFEYVIGENENNSEIKKIVESYVDKKLKDYFDVVANKIDQLEDRFNDEIAVIKNETKSHVVVDNNAPSEITPKATSTKKPKKNKSKNTSKLIEQILNCIPEMTEKECLEHFNEIKNRCENVPTQRISQKLKDEATPKVIAEKLGYARGTVGIGLSLLGKQDDIKFIKVNSHPKAPKVYVRIISEPESPEDVVNPDSNYQYKNLYINPGYELINNQFIKTKKGKPLAVTAEQLKELSKKVDGKRLTIGLFNECCDYLKECGVNEYDFERIIQHLVNGYFSMVLSRYEKYLKTEVNARFEVYNGTLLVNGKDTKLNVKEVKNMIDNYPYGFSDERIEEYIRGLIDKYTFCPADCIRVILKNYYFLTDLLKEEKSFVENNPRKRKEKGIIF